MNKLKEKFLNFKINTLFYWAVSVIILTILRFGLRKHVFMEGDYYNIVAGVQYWMKNHFFSPSEVYRYHFQFGSYYLLYFISNIARVFGNATVAELFWYSNLVSGSIAIGCLSVFFVEVFRLYPKWIIVLSFMMMGVPEILINTTSYATTTTLALMFVSLGYCFLRPPNVRISNIRMLFAVLSFSFSLMCRLDSVFMFVPIFICLKDKRIFVFKNIRTLNFVFLGSVLVIWTAGAVWAGFSFKYLLEDVQAHFNLCYTLKNRLLMIVAGCSPNILFLFFVFYVYLNLKGKLSERFFVPILFGVPSLINFLYLTTPKYCIPFFIFMSVVVFSGLYDIYYKENNIVLKVSVYCMFLFYFIHLGVGIGYSKDGTFKLKTGLNISSSYIVSTDDKSRVIGNVLGLLIHEPSIDLKRELEDVLQHARKLNSKGDIVVYSLDWNQWGFFQERLLEKCQSIDSFGCHPLDKKYPIFRRYFFGRRSIELVFPVSEIPLKVAVKGYIGQKYVLFPKKMLGWKSWNDWFMSQDIKRTVCCRNWVLFEFVD